MNIVYGPPFQVPGQDSLGCSASFKIRDTATSAHACRRSGTACVRHGHRAIDLRFRSCHAAGADRRVPDILGRHQRAASPQDHRRPGRQPRGDGRLVGRMARIRSVIVVPCRGRGDFHHARWRVAGGFCDRPHALGHRQPAGTSAAYGPRPPRRPRAGSTCPRHSTRRRRHRAARRPDPRRWADPQRRRRGSIRVRLRASRCRPKKLSATKSSPAR